MPSSVRATTSSAPSSFGVTLGRRISSAARSPGSTTAIPTPFSSPPGLPRESKSFLAHVRTRRRGWPGQARPRGMKGMTAIGYRQSIAQQFVDRRLGTGLRVYLLDDDRAIKAWARVAIRQVLAGQRSRHHHRIAWHAAQVNLAGVAI